MVIRPRRQSRSAARRRMDTRLALPGPRSGSGDLGATALAQDVSLHLAAGGLGQLVDEVHGPRKGVRGELLLDHLLEFGGERLVATVATAEDDERLQNLPAQRVGPPDDRGL